MRLRKQKSRKDQVTDLAIDYLKLKAAGKAAKGAGRAAKGTAVYKVAKKPPVVKRIPVVIGAGVAALVTIKIVKGRSGDAQAAHSILRSSPLRPRSSRGRATLSR